MRGDNRVLLACGLAVIAAMLVVGVVAHEIVRHLLQTAPIWIAVLLAWRGSRLARWAAVPVFAFWLFVMAMVWLFLLGIARIARGHYSPTEIAMTLVAGLACLVGLVAAVRASGRAPWPAAVGVLALVAALQAGLMAVSFRPPIAHDAQMMAAVKRLGR
jgi:hypothetical protein